MDKKFKKWFDKFGKEAANTENDTRIKKMLLETSEYVGNQVNPNALEQFVMDLKGLTEDPNFAGTGVYITALMQKICDAGKREVRVNFHQLGETPRHLGSFLKGNPEQKPEIVLYGNLDGGVAGVGIENVVLHIAGYTGLLDAILIGGDGKYGMTSYGAAMHAKDSTIIFHDKEYNSASGFKAENCEFFAKVEPERTLSQIHERAGKGCTFFTFNDKGEAYQLTW